MTTNLQNAIIACSSIGSLLSNYNPNETNKNIKQIRSDVKKMMFKRSKTNEREFKEAIAIADKAWRDTIDHFVSIDEKIAIEALYSMMVIADLYAEPLKRFANISEKKIEKVMFRVSSDLKYEKNSMLAMNHYLDLLAESTGIKRKENVLKSRAYTIKQNLIIEGKIA